MKIGKNRQGPLGTVPIVFNKPVFTFYEPTNAQLAARPITQDEDYPDEGETAGLGGHSREDNEDTYVPRLLGGNPEGINWAFDSMDEVTRKKKAYALSEAGKAAKEVETYGY
jgi:hypothetical protein